MSTGSKFMRFAGIAFLCVGTFTYAATAQSHRKAKKPAAPQLPPLPSGPTGPVPQMPLDTMAAVPPRVTYQNGQLTIVSPNSTLGDILRAVKKQTGAEIEVPSANERVVTTLGPGPAREVIADLLNGSRFNYVLLGSPEDSNALTRVVLVAKSGQENMGAAANNNGMQSLQQQQPMIQANMAPPPQPEMAAQENNDAEAAPEENQDDSADQQANAEAEQQQQQVQPEQPDQPGVKTPQQMLQEMQQRQLQMQQNQPPGQPPIPGSGMPPHPPQEP